MFAKPYKFRPTAFAVAAALCLVASMAQAQQTAGSISGRVQGGEAVTIENQSFGVVRQVRADSSGSFQVGQLPAGTYRVTVSRANGSKEFTDVVVSSGVGSVAQFAATQSIVVTGTATRSIDVKSTESTQVLSKAEIDRIPVSRDVTSITMLAPGATLGDSRLGNSATTQKSPAVPSLGGASPAENTYYINGFNVTNIVNGVAFNTLPFEAIGEHQVKTGGYGAEFGRSLGGVVNITTKRGTNEWKGGVSMYAEPVSLRGTSLYAERDPASHDWTLYSRDGGLDRWGMNVWGGGPLIKDKLFFFGVVQAETLKNETFGASQYTNLKNNSPQYLVKLDWNINDSNTLEFTAFSDKTTDKWSDYKVTNKYKFNPATDSLIGPSEKTAGGDNYIAKWTGVVNQNLTLSALVGTGVYDRASALTGPDCPIVRDQRKVPTILLGCSPQANVDDPDAKDKRTAGRFDVEWAMNSMHTIKGGLDYEMYDVKDGTRRPGEGDYRILLRTPGQKLSNGYVIPGTSNMEVVSFRHLENGGKFKTINSAWYLEDAMQVTKDILVSAGIRNESFTNKNADGVPFIKVKNTWAPRFGASWDLNGDAKTKIFANAGRYYIPVYANTNVRLSGAELDYTEFYKYGGSLSNDRFQRPALGEMLGTRVLVSDGKTPNPLSVVDENIKPMYQDEFIIGMQKALKNRWSAGVKYTHRTLKSGMDDMCNDEGPGVWAAANGYSQDQADRIGAAIGHCFLYNPGGDLTANIDIDGSGKLTRVVIPAAALNIPVPKRNYDALEFTVEREWDKKWSMRASYVYSRLKGNTEGYVKSDIGQDDAGISQDFDYPGLMEGASGFLPNDRTHTFKVYGSFAVSDELRLGANALAQSGRPKNCFGVYGGTLDTVSPAYGDASFWCDGKLNPRGSFGRLPWTYQLDLQANYAPASIKGLSFQIDIMNVFNSRAVRGILEAEDSGMNGVDSAYGQPIVNSLQPARKVRLQATYEF